MTTKSIPEVHGKSIDALDLNPRAIYERAERTPGAVAVSGGVRQEAEDTGGGKSPLPVLPQTNSKNSPNENSTCGNWAVLSECESGEHRFAKKIYCGKEWCPICGENDSPAHNRRIARLIPKVQQILSMGYFVIEFPDLYRTIGQRGVDPDPDIDAWCYSKKDLQSTSRIITDVLAGKRMGRRGRVGGFFQRGLMRWHWFGDKEPGKWNPHCNVMVDSAYIEPDKLNEIKAELRRALNCPELIVHYSFSDNPGKVYHYVKYITRATFRNYSWNEYMANELFGFRNIRWWGRWEDEPAWDINQVDEDTEGFAEINSLLNGICPECGLPLKVLRHNHQGKPVMWTSPVDSTWLMLWGAQELGNTGFYRLPAGKWEGSALSPTDYIRLDEMEARKAELIRIRLYELEVESYRNRLK